MESFILAFLICLTLARIHNQEITSRVYFDIEVDGIYEGKVYFGLYGKVAPKTAENFRVLCTGENGVNSDGVRLHFKDTKFHKISKGAYIQGGNIDGKGGMSIYGKYFPDEEFKLDHSY